MCNVNQQLQRNGWVGTKKFTIRRFRSSPVFLSTIDPSSSPFFLETLNPKLRRNSVTQAHWNSKYEGKTSTKVIDINCRTGPGRVVDNNEATSLNSESPKTSVCLGSDLGWSDRRPGSRLMEGGDSESKESMFYPRDHKHGWRISVVLLICTLCDPCCRPCRYRVTPFFFDNNNNYNVLNIWDVSFENRRVVNGNRIFLGKC